MRTIGIYFTLLFALPTWGQTNQSTFTSLKLDSSQIESFIRQHDLEGLRAKQIREFYSSRDFQYVWFTEDGLGEHAQAYWNLHDQFVNYSQDSSFFDKQLHQQMSMLMDSIINPRTAEITTTELHLTEHFLDFSKSAYIGRLNPKELRWHIPRKKINTVELLDSLLKHPSSNLADWEPVSNKYKLIEQKLLHYYDIQKSGGWATTSLPKRALREGDTELVISEIKKRFTKTGDLPVNDSTPLFDKNLLQAVKVYQQRNGLKDDGIIGPAVTRALNIPIEDRIKTMLINMERMRWLPESSSSKSVMVNIPEFRLHVYNNKKEVMEMDIVVGKDATRTVIFSGDIKHVVFRPYWNVPRSIVRNEILPAIKKDTRYLARHNMEIRGHRNGLPIIRQKPGGKNALGKVKFLFPNRYSIYLHDTPAKSLFARNKRSFSHGCIRISEPAVFAEYLLNDNNEWPLSRVEESMSKGGERWITLKETVPV